MKRELSSFLFSGLCLVLVPAAFASTILYVNGVSGSDSNNCLSPTTACKTIGHALSLAAPGDSVRVAPAIYTENLSISFTLAIVGASARTTIVDGGAINSVITTSAKGVSLSNLTLRNGKAEWGGGIYNAGTLTLNSSTVSGNSSVGKFFAPAKGGGIYNVGTLTINNSTVSGNIARGGVGGAGGGIFSADATLVITNTTISGNQTAGGGAGILTGGYTGTLSLNNVTISGNSGEQGSGVDNIYNTATIQNSIIANNSGGDCAGGMSSQGYNLSSDSTCPFNGPGDMNNTDPMLGPLQNNGGPTSTMALPSGSAAIDAGNPAGCTDGLGHLLKRDQRGEPRPDKEDTGGCDMGAYERQSD